MNMEVSNSLILIIFPLIIPFLFPYLMKLFRRRNSQLPPGNTGWPFLGETLDFYTKAQQGVVEDFVAERSKKYSSNIFKTSLIGQPMVVLYGAEGNKFLFSDEKSSLKHWWPSSIDKLFPNSGKKTNAERAQTMRRFISSILKGDALREYVAVFDATIKQQLPQIKYPNSNSNFNNHQVVKISEMARKYTFTSACRIFLGIEDPRKIEEIEEGIKIVAIGLHSTPINFPGTALHRGIKVSGKLRKELEAVIRRKKVELATSSGSAAERDFVSHMVLSRDDNGESINEVDMASHLTGVLQAAYASVHTTITNVMKYLAEFPEVYNLVLKEQQEIASSKGSKDRLSWEDVRKMKYSWEVICEVLRLLPPGLGGFKEALTDLNYGGYTIPKGWKANSATRHIYFPSRGDLLSRESPVIHWNTYATHKNPEYFPDPERFDPSRFGGDGPASYTYVPFGGGTRMCPGNDYARIAVLIFLHNVVTKFRWEKYNPEEELLHDPLPRPAEGLPVYLHPHN